MEMTDVIKYLEENAEVSLKANEIISGVIDPVYDYIREQIGINIILLNKSRKLLREGSTSTIEQGMSDYEKFKKNWMEIDLKISRVKSLLPSNKNIQIIEEMLEKAVNRDIQTKIPEPPKNYLTAMDIDESDIDWIIKKIKDYWTKYSQIYASSRVNYLLRVM
jgi:5-bromo-4-chloroindolyl phosphate hydrolysis protein